MDGDHKLIVSATDIESKTSTSEVNFSKEPPYSPQFDGELLYMPFDGNYMDLIGFEEATKVGTPGFSGSGYVGSDAYRGAADSYLTFPLEGLANTEFSAAFWYKVDATPDRGGILTVGNDTPENRKQGFRLFREGSPTEQRIKLNVGFGADESWNDGGVTTRSKPRHNLTGDPYFTAGLRAVLMFDRRPYSFTEIQRFDWEESAVSTKLKRLTIDQQQDFDE